MKKAIISFFVITLIFLSFSAFSVYAEDVRTDLVCFSSVEKLAPQNSTNVFKDYFDADEFETQLRKAVMNFEPSLNISKYKIPFSMLAELYFFFSDNLTDCFHVNLDGVWTAGEGGNIVKMDFEYLIEKDQYDEYLEIWNSTIDAFLYGIKDNSALTDVQKALLIHDRIIAHCEYDYDDLLLNSVPKASYTPFGVVIKGIAVCQGYAELYSYLMNILGIECYLCSSDALDHIWNIVVIDGEYYYVDVTWDDAVWDISGRALHDNFLCSYEKFKESHKANDYDQTPSSTKYDDAFWCDSESTFEIINGEIYYFDLADGRVETYDGEPVFSVNFKWKYVGNYTRLASYDGYLFYSSPSAIYYYDTLTKTAKKVFEPKNIYNDEYTVFEIYGFRLYDGKYVCEFFHKPAFLGSTKSTYTQYGIMELAGSATVDYDPMGGTACPDKVLVRIGADFAVSEYIPERKGFDFIGWSLTENGEAVYFPGDTITAAENMTLYAVWKNTAIPVSSVDIESEISTLMLGDEMTLTAKVMPENATDKSLIWSSSNEDVITVSEGKIKAVGMGKAKITVESADGKKSDYLELTVYENSDEKMNISVGSVLATAGNRVEVSIAFETNPGFSDLSILLEYNSDVMTLEGYSSLSQWTPTSDFDLDSSSNPVSFSWHNDSNIPQTGKVVTLVFLINEDAEIGEYGLKLSVKTPIANQQYQIIEYALTDGKITVVDTLPGDCDGNGVTNISDAVRLAQHLAGWKIEINEAAIDCNGDGDVNILDAVLLAQYLAGWEVKFGQY